MTMNFIYNPSDTIELIFDNTERRWKAFVNVCSGTGTPISYGLQK
jgi:hypothetical protein